MQGPPVSLTPPPGSEDDGLEPLPPERSTVRRRRIEVEAIRRPRVAPFGPIVSGLLLSAYSALALALVAVAAAQPPTQLRLFSSYVYGGRSTWDERALLLAVMGFGVAAIAGALAALIRRPVPHRAWFVLACGALGVAALGARLL